MSVNLAINVNDTSRNIFTPLPKILYYISYAVSYLCIYWPWTWLSHNHQSWSCLTLGTLWSWSWLYLCSSQVVLTITLQPPFCHILTLKLLVSLFLKGLQMLDLESFWVSTSGIQMWLQQRGKHWISCSALTFEFAPALPINNMQGCLTLALLVGGHASHSSRWITVWICPKNYTSH